jgi:hypothetical protein
MNIAQKQSNPPPSWGKEEIRHIAEFYYSLTEEEWVAHYKAAYEQEGYTRLIVPAELMGPIGQLIARAEHDCGAACVNDPTSTPAKQPTPQEGNFPPGWNSERVQRLIAEMEDEEANWTAEEEAELQMQMKGKTSVQVPDELVPAIEALLARHEAETASTD